MMDRLLRGVASAAGAIAMAALALLVALTVVDVGGRYFLNKPLFGAVELTEFLLLFVAFGGFALAEQRNAHVTVDFFTSTLRPRVRAGLESLAALLGAAFWLLVAWRTSLQAFRIRDVNDVSFNLAIPVFPFYWAVVVGSMLFALMLLARAARIFRSEAS